MDVMDCMDWEHGTCFVAPHGRRIIEAEGPQKNADPLEKNAGYADYKIRTTGAQVLF